MNKKVVHITLLIAGMVLAVMGGIVFRDMIPKSVGGVCIGVGAGIFGMSFSNLWMMSFNKKHPEQMKQSEIEFADERNTMIRNKAKAKAADIVQWFIMGIAYITILIGSPLWVTLVTVGVFLLKYILELYFMNRYQNEL
jgi:hypothetical protein